MQHRLKYLFLFLLWVVCEAASNHDLGHQDDFLIEGLEEIVPAYGQFEGKMYAGQLPMDNGKDRTGYLMFWLYAPDQPAVPDSLVIWLNGGPGCSSFLGGNLFENSPVAVPLRPAGECCTSEDDPIVYNKYAWTNATNMLYIEQPIGTGFSRGEPEPVNEHEVSGDFYTFMTNFYRVFNGWEKKRLFVVGESYAGYYVPSIAHRIFHENEEIKMQKTARDHAILMNLAGIGLGNAWMDAKVQGQVVIDYAYWHGMLDQYTRDNLHARWEHCMNSPPSEPEPEPFHKFNIPDECALMMGTLMAAGKKAWPKNEYGPNTYDVTTWDPYVVLQDGDNSCNRFFNDHRVKKIIHAPMEIEWRGCIPGAGRRRLLERRLYLEQDRPESMVPYVAELLDKADIRVLVYNGDRDMSTCAQGSEMLLNSMEWSGADKWQEAKRGLWVVDDSEVGGYAKEHKNLQFVVVYNSGHLVPYNQPRPALDLITRFLNNESFLDHDLPSFAPKKTPEPAAPAKSAHDPRVLLVLLVLAVALAAGFVAWRRRGIRFGYRNLPSGISEVEEVYTQRGV